MTWSAVCEISLSFNDALVRHYFDQSIGMISDHVTLTDAELIREYDSLKSEHQADSEEFLRACYEISLKQRQLDLKFMAMESELLLKTLFDAYSNHGKYNLNKALKEYFKARNFQKEVEINLLLDRLGRLIYDSFKLVTRHWSANYCNLFGVMRKAKLIKPVINIDARKLEENPYRMGQRIALRSQDMTAARLTFLMLRAQKLLLPDYDFYLNCNKKLHTF